MQKREGAYFFFSCFCIWDEALLLLSPLHILSMLSFPPSSSFVSMFPQSSMLFNLESSLKLWRWSAREMRWGRQEGKIWGQRRGLKKSLGRGGGCVFGSSPKRLERPHPDLVHWWLLVHSSQIWLHFLPTLNCHTESQKQKRKRVRGAQTVELVYPFFFLLLPWVPEKRGRMRKTREWKWAQGGNTFFIHLDVKRFGVGNISDLRCCRSVFDCLWGGFKVPSELWQRCGDCRGRGGGCGIRDQNKEKENNNENHMCRGKGGRRAHVRRKKWAMACVYIPVQNTSEEVRVALEQLPKDATDILDILKAEQAPLNLWLTFAVQSSWPPPALPLLPRHLLLFVCLYSN